MREFVESANSSLEAAPPVASPVEPRWPGSMALLTAWWMPATTARRTQHVSLLRAFGVHILASILASCVLMILVAWEDTRRGRPFEVALERLVAEILRELARGLNRWPLETIAAIGGIVLLIEGGFVVLSLLLAPWGAADERLRTSMANALRHVWLHTADALPVFLLVGLITVPLSHVQQDWYSTAYPITTFASPPLPPTPPANAQVNSKEWKEYTEKRQAYSEALNAFYAEQSKTWEELYKTRPWLVRYAEVILGATFMAAGVWVLWAMIRAVGAWRPVPAIARPPMCETCGYNLTMMPLEARCPECGIPVLDSLGPAVRPGAPWERRRKLGWLSAWRQTALDAVLRPAWLGRQVRVCTRVTDHRQFLPLWFLPLFVIGYLTIAGIIWVDTHRNPFVYEPEVYGIAPVVGGLVATLGVFGPLAAAGVVGLILSLGHRRNLVPAAMQLAVYMSGLLTLFAFLSAALGLAVVAALEGHLIRSFQFWLHIDDEVLGFLGWAVPSFGLVLVYLHVLYRGTRGAGHANR